MLNSVFRATLRRATPALAQFSKKGSQRLVASPAYSRALWHMSSRTPNDVHNASHSHLCGCGCRSLIHTRGESELVNFLKEEIAAERKALKIKSLPKELDGFSISTKGAELELTKQCEGETITVSMNVNHSVDADVEPEVDIKADNADLGELRSKPNFEVDIVRGGQTLSFSCSYSGAGDAEPDNEGYNDAFCIDEVTLFEGEWNDNTYAVAGDVLDGNLYDLLMTILEEKGISSEFADKLSEVATAYEHTSYINMLENLSKFASK